MADRRFATEFINRPMAGIRTGGTANRPAITTRGSLGLFPDDNRISDMPLPQIGSGAYSRLAATQQPSPYDDAIMRRTRGMGALPAGGGLPAPPPAPESPSLMDRLTPAMGTPAQAGLASAAATGLQLSGYRPVPITTAEGLGAMMQAGMKSYNEAKAAEAAAKRADLADRIAIAQLNKKSDFESRLELAGIDPTTPEGQKKVQEMLMKSDTIFMGGDKQKEEAYKAALATRKVMQQQVEKDRELGVRLETVIDLLRGGAETGRISAAMLPLKQLAAEAGLLGDEELQNLTNQEVINSVASYLVPRMRVVGSGASSDKDMDFFSKSTVRMANTPEANLVIATMQKQIMDYNKKRLSLFERYVKKHGDDFGFADFADEKMGRVYQRAMTDEQFTQLVDDGLIKEGDVFFNGKTNEFDVLEKDMM